MTPSVVPSFGSELYRLLVATRLPAPGMLRTITVGLPGRYLPRCRANSRAVAAAMVGLLEGLMIRQYADPELTELATDYSALVGLILDGIST